MYFLNSSPITLQELLMGKEEWSFLFETVLRSFIMFIIILVSLRLLGKRGVKQLSVFELVVIIGLGSAAGDPMFYKDVGIVPAIVVFLMVVALYTFLTRIIAKSKKIEALIEGRSVCLIKEGVFSINSFKKEVLSEDEFFSELRQRGISHLGQVEEAIVETSGNISVFFYPDDEIKPGLPIMPDSLDSAVYVIDKEGSYSCTFCGHTQSIEPVDTFSCPVCKRTEWVNSSDKKRVG